MTCDPSHGVMPLEETMNNSTMCRKQPSIFKSLIKVRFTNGNFFHYWKIFDPALRSTISPRVTRVLHRP